MAFTQVMNDLFLSMSPPEMAKESCQSCGVHFSLETQKLFNITKFVARHQYLKVLDILKCIRRKKRLFSAMSHWSIAKNWFVDGDESH